MLPPTIHVIDLGLIDFKEAWALQENLLQHGLLRKQQLRDGTGDARPGHYLLLCEHPHVFTLGKNGKAEHLLLSYEALQAKQISYYPINRGGDITYHGPGQLVAYPIIDLEVFFTDIGKYLRLLEQSIINLLQDFGVKAERYPGYTGVWLDAKEEKKARKICAAGIRCSRWITMHGLAFNVNNNLDYFKYIIPCGIHGKDVTSLAQELGYNVDMEKVKSLFVAHFMDLLSAEANFISYADLQHQM